MRARLAAWLFRHLFNRVACARAPDFVVGADDPNGAYLRRWWLIPRNPVFNVYLHHFLRDDDDRALHDHPWAWLSFLLAGEYTEHTIEAGGVHRRRRRTAGSLRVSSPWRAHRITLRKDPLLGGQGSPYSLILPVPCWTLFITGPRLRNWTFHCPQTGKVPWQRFTAPGKPGEIGLGCDA